MTLGYDSAPPESGSINNRVRCWSEAQPTAAALTTGGIDVTYAQLDVQSELLAAELHTLGVVPGTALGIAMPRCPDFVVAALAVLKAGGYYIPIDPACSSGLLELIRRDADPGLMVCDASSAPRWARARLRSLPLSAGLTATRPQPVGCVPKAASPCGDQTACVVYPTGPDELPRRTVVTHADVLEIMRSDQRRGVRSGVVVTQLAAVSSASAVFEIWGALGNGARLELPDGGEDRADGGRTGRSRPAGRGGEGAGRAPRR